MDSRTQQSGSGSESVDAGPDGAASTDSPDASSPKPQNPAAEAFARIGQGAAELKEYARFYVAARMDRYRGSARRIGLWAVVVLLGAVAGCAVIAVGVGLVLMGFAEGLAILFGGRVWLADLVAGVVVLGVVSVVVWMMVKKATGRWRAATLKKYEERKQSQRERFGHDVESRAESAMAEQESGKPHLSEAEFLAEQQEKAKAAISRTLADMKQAVAQGADVREWTRQHPWVLMGTAAVAGVLAGALLTPSKEETFKEFFEEKWEKFKEKMTPDVDATAERMAAKPAEAKGSVLGTVLRETIKAVGPALVGLITSLNEQREGEHSGNGHNGETPGEHS